MSDQKQEKTRPGLGVILPLILFAIVGVLFMYSLATSEKGGKKLPSALIGKSVPEFSLGKLTGLADSQGAPFPSFSSKSLQASGKLSIVNIWSSWCTSCRYEHPYLEELARKTGANLYGLNYKDSNRNALAFIKKYGNPYKAIGTDESGRVGIEWGVYGVPETFVIAPDGKIIYKYPGPVDSKIIDNVLLPAIRGKVDNLPSPVS